MITKLKEELAAIVETSAEISKSYTRTIAEMLDQDKQLDGKSDIHKIAVLHILIINLFKLFQKSFNTQEHAQKATNSLLQRLKEIHEKII